MPDRVGVRSAALITHAGTVEAIAGRVSTAASAGAAVRAADDAYGQLCVMVPVMLNGLQDVLVDGIRSAAESLHDTGARLRTTATEYDTTDRRRADVFNAMRDDR
jgi:excreted virulence factor EspC (type VII ESX diderm)